MSQIARIIFRDKLLESIRIHVSRNVLTRTIINKMFYLYHDRDEKN